jgi:parvulin-like peptidyl-prolyl isomerase
MSAADLYDKIVAKVDNAIITQSDIDDVAFASIEQIKKQYPKKEWKSHIRQLKKQILDQMINEYVCVRFARDNDIKITDEEIQSHIETLKKNAGIVTDEEFQKELEKENLTLAELKESIKRQSLMRRVLQKEIYSKINITENEIRNYYNEHIDLFKIPAQVHVKLLLLEVPSNSDENTVKKKAYEIYSKLEEGADFDKLVQKYSAGPSIDQGGDIGVLKQGEGLPEFEKVAFNLDNGEFSKPFRTKHGWNIIKVLDKKERTFISLEKKHDEIELLLKKQKARTLEMEWFEKQRSRTYIEILSVE